MERNYLNKCGNKEEESHLQEVNQLGLKTHVKELSLNLDEACKGNKAATCKSEDYTTLEPEPDGAKEYCGINALTINMNIIIGSVQGTWFYHLLNLFFWSDFFCFYKYDGNFEASEKGEKKLELKH